MARIEIFHDSHELSFRSPFGAVACGQLVQLRLQVRGAGKDAEVILRLWQDRDGVGEILVPMQLEQTVEGKNIFGAAIQAPAQPTLLWYYFILRWEGKTYYCGNNAARYGGKSVQCNDAVPPSFQITVYLQGAQTPTWFKNAVVYQIFIDRFYNGHSDGRVQNPKPGSMLHASWSDRPFYVRDPASRRIVAYDFFGGNLAGVQDKLGYLRGLGITAIYFNPLFEARSNHRYDTGDYHRIDPMVGTNEEFAAFCAAAREQGIAVILDGVFSHTGSDSKYFNRYGNYPDVGAYNAKTSSYFPWYRFSVYPDKYEAWWGIDDLPNVNEMEHSYLEFIIRGPAAVVPYWLHQGAKGWRLDVVDELPDAFVKLLYARVKQIDPEAVVIGEVWEDASNKASYGVRREYLYGEELDSVMNYPLRRIMLEFLLGQRRGGEVHQACMNLHENYPIHNFYSLLNLIGSHDVPRILTLLGEAPVKESLSEQEQYFYHLAPAQRQLALARTKLAVLWQMTFPGVPCIYYGDEAGVEGYADPYNRSPFPWGREDQAIQEWHRQLLRLRQLDCFRTGEWRSLELSDEAYGYVRQIRGERDVFGQPAQDSAAVVLLNRHRERSVKVNVAAEEWCPHYAVDWLAGREEVIPRAGKLEIELAPLEGKVLIARAKPLLQRGAGVLLHPTSLPSSHGIGDFGTGAERFVDWLAAARQRYWQILPLHPVGHGDSPYQCPSAFAGNPLLLAPEKLVAAGWLLPEEIAAAPVFPPGRIDYPAVVQWKEGLYRLAFSRFCCSRPAEFRKFVMDEQHWLEDYVLFAALRRHFGGKPWTAWPRGIATRQIDAVRRWRKTLALEVQYQQFLQYAFFRQWQELRCYAQERGIQVIGDIPIFVAHDSADVWANQGLFKLGEGGQPVVVAGVPPDYFSPTGQRWGNPHYCWDAMAKDGYSWWARRVETLLKLVDVVRIDHFRGFVAGWEIPGSEATAEHGQWVRGPGSHFFQAMAARLGQVPWIAEDLGVITPEVEDLRDRFGLPGMRILQFALCQDPEGSAMPLAANRNTVLYSGTHDNATLAGWYQDIRVQEQGKWLRRWLEVAADGAGETSEVCDKLLCWLYESNAQVVILPLQDILGLDNNSRMNTPGTVEGNWGWRYTDQELERVLPGKWAALAVETHR